MIKRVPWIRRLKKTGIEAPLRLPIACGPVSNGEGWWPDTPRKKLIRKLVLEKAEEISRKEGIDRREFLASACGMATSLYMINLVNGCSSGKLAHPDNNLGTGSVNNPASGSAAGMGSGSALDGGTRSNTGSSGSNGGGTSGRGSNATAGNSGTMTGSGGFDIPKDAMVDEHTALCAMGMNGNELIIDMQSHFASPETNPFGAAGLQTFVGQISIDRFPWLKRTAGCSASACFDRKEYVDQIYMGSDTTIGVLSGISYSLGADGTGTGGFAALSNEDLLDGATYLRGMFPGRMLTHCMVMPNDRIDIQLAMMERNASTYDNWKTYPPWDPSGNSGYWLDGMDDPTMAGPKMIQKGLDLNSPIFCVHKGFPLNSFSPVYTNPRDVGPAANMFPKAYFVIYHSAFEHGLAAGATTDPSDAADPGYGWMGDCGSSPTQRMGGMWPEGPYDDKNADVMAKYPLDRGVNSLIKSLRDNNIGPNGTRLDGSDGPTTNVYAECGGVWPCLLTGRVEEAMHYWGKLLLHIGEDRIVWGTDCLWFGSPQPVIQAFRCFQISEEFQMKYGYPALTQARKEKILGQNAAKLQNVRNGINIHGCHADYAGKMATWKRELDEEFGPRRDMLFNVPGPKTRREFLRLRAHEHAEKVAWSGRIPPYLRRG
jgi:predicted TIM-barrel fold metal-dependent hydrolase